MISFVNLWTKYCIRYASCRHIKMVEKRLEDKKRFIIVYLNLIIVPIYILPHMDCKLFLYVEGLAKINFKSMWYNIDTQVAGEWAHCIRHGRGVLITHFQGSKNFWQYSAKDWGLKFCVSSRYIIEIHHYQWFLQQIYIKS